MKTNEDYILRDIDGESMLIPIREASVLFNGVIHLTDTAAFIWKQVDTADCVEEIVRRLVAAYKVTEKEAREDVYGFLGELYRRDIVLEIPELDSMEKRDIGNQ